MKSKSGEPESAGNGSMSTSMLRLWAFILIISILLIFGKVKAKASTTIENETYNSSIISYRLPSKPGDTFVRLKNGLTVLIRELPGSDVFSAIVIVRVGSIYEPPLSGLSHYLEHVVSGGTTTDFTEEEARKRLNRIGGATNASTSYNSTRYYITTSSRFYREALDLLLSYVNDCVFRKSEVSREKGVILQEFQLGKNSPARQLWYLFMENAYRVHPVRYPVIGREDIFKKQTRQALMDYYHTFYQPSRMVLAVAGNVKANDVLSFVVTKTRNWTDMPVEEPPLPEEPLPTGTRRIEKSLPFVRQPRTMIGFPSVTLFDLDMYPLDVLAYILGGSKTSRLVTEIQEKQKLVSHISAFNWTPSFVRGQFIISFTEKSQDERAIEKAIKTVVDRIKQKGISNKELKKAKKNVIASFIFSKETAFEQASSLANSFLETGNPYFDRTYVEEINKVSKKDVVRVAKQYMKWKYATIARVTPQKREQTQVTTTTTARQNLHSPGKPEFFLLSNGLKVLVKRDTQLPIITIQLYGIGGQILEPSDKPGLAHLTASLLTAGTKKHSKQELIERIEDVGGSISVGSGRNTYFISIQVLKEDFKRAVGVLSEIVQDATFPVEELEKERQDTLLALKRSREDWQRELILIFHSHYFSKHPYKRNILGTESSVERITRREILNFYKKMVVPQNSVLAVYGDVDPADVKKLLVKKLSNWKNNENIFFSKRLPVELKPTSPTQSIIERNKKSAVGIFLGTGGLDLKSPHRPALDVLDAVLSGIRYPSGMLYEALRGGKRSLVYVIHAFPFYGVNAGYFGIMAQTTPENRERVCAIIFDKLKEFQQKPLSREQVQVAKDMILTMKTISLQSIEAQARNSAINEVLGLGWNYDAKYRDSLKEVSPLDVLKLARKLFSKWLLVQTIPQDVGSGETAR